MTEGVNEGEVAGSGVEADGLKLGLVRHQRVSGLEVDILARRSVMDYCHITVALTEQTERATW